MGNVIGLLRTIAAFGSLVLMSLGVDAARVERAQADNCRYLLTGTIEPGDFERLKEAVDQSWDSGDGGSSDLCLNSPGGDFSEAIKIINLLSEGANSIGTVVDRGASCLGVCAYIFMAGRAVLDHDLTEPMRKLHVGGRLGFRITLQSGSGETPPDAVERSYNEGVRAIGALLRRNTSIQRGARGSQLPFPRLLLADALASGPDELLLIDTIGRVARYGIDLIGYDAPTTTITEQGVRRACLRAAGKKRGTVLELTTAALPDRPIALRQGQLLRTSMPIPGEKGLLCVADLYLSAKQGLQLQVAFGKSLASKDVKDVLDRNGFKRSVDAGDPTPGAPMWYALPEETRLSDLSAR